MTNLPAVRQQNNLITLGLPEIRERAELLVKSGLLPESIRTPEQAIVIALKGQELGLPMLQSFEDLFIIQGKVGMFTRLMIQRYLDRGHVYQITEATAKRCAIKFVRTDGRVYEHAIAIEEAVAAGWNQAWDKEKGAFKDKPTWKNPRVMLMWATFRNGIKFFAPDVLDPDMIDADVVEGQIVMPEDGQEDDAVDASNHKAMPVAAPAPVQATEEGPADWANAAVRDELFRCQAECTLDDHAAIMALSRAAGKDLKRRGEWGGTLTDAKRALVAYAAERDGKIPTPAEQKELF